MPTFFFPLKPNAGRQARLEAGAERTLEAVACTPLFGAGFGTDTGPPSCCWPGAAKHTDSNPDCALC